MDEVIEGILSLNELKKRFKTNNIGFEFREKTDDDDLSDELIKNKYVYDLSTVKILHPTLSSLVNDSTEFRNIGDIWIVKYGRLDSWFNDQMVVEGYEYIHKVTPQEFYYEEMNNSTVVLCETKLINSLNKKIVFSSLTQEHVINKFINLIDLKTLTQKYIVGDDVVAKYGDFLNWKFITDENNLKVETLSKYCYKLINKYTIGEVGDDLTLIAPIANFIKWGKIEFNGKLNLEFLQKYFDCKTIRLHNCFDEVKITLQEYLSFCEEEVDVDKIELLRKRIIRNKNVDVNIFLLELDRFNKDDLIILFNNQKTEISELIIDSLTVDEVYVMFKNDSVHNVFFKTEIKEKIQNKLVKKHPF